MKRILCVLILLCMIISLCACSAKIVNNPGSILSEEVGDENRLTENENKGKPIFYMEMSAGSVYSTRFFQILRP